MPAHTLDDIISSIHFNIMHTETNFLQIYSDIGRNMTNSKCYINWKGPIKQNICPFPSQMTNMTNIYVEDIIAL